MKIIKHGKPLKEPNFLFKCPTCGCKFEATQTDLRQAQQSLVYFALYKCPECGTITEGKKINE